MALQRVIQTAFSTGEISPRLYGRSDLDQYRHACKVMSNAAVFKQGGWTRRNGMRFVDELHDSAKHGALIKFRDSRGSHVLALCGDGTGTFYSNGAVEPSAFGYHVAHSYADSEIADIRYVQINDLGFGDILILVHPAHAPFMIWWTGTVYGYDELPAWDGPYLPANTTAVTITPGAASAGTSTTLTASSAIFVPGHVGALFRITQSGLSGFARVTAYTSGTVVTATIVKSLVDTSATAVWAEGAWSPYRGYPRDATTYQQRLVFARTASQPDYIWGTQSGQLYRSANAIMGWSRWLNMDAGTALDNEAITFQIQDVKDIQWISGGRSLVVGGIEAVVALDGGSDSIMAPANPPIARRTAFGCSLTAPVAVHNGLVFLQRSGMVVREHIFDYASDGYAAADLTALADHIMGDGAIQLDYEQGPRSIVWAVKAEGTLAGMTYEKANNVVAWHRHDTDGLVESLVSVTGDEGTNETTWMVVNRTIGGQTKRYIEYFDPDLSVDSGVSYLATDTLLDGLDHLEGETVDIVVEDVKYPPQIVTAGAVPRPADGAAQVGLHYDTDVTPVHPDVQTAFGVGRSTRRRYEEVAIQVYQSAGFSVNGRQYVTRRGADVPGAAPPLRNGWQVLENVDWGVEPDITIQQHDPLPLTVTAMEAFVLGEDK